MEYFIITQDKQFTDSPQPLDIREKIDVPAFYKNESHFISNRTLVQIEPSDHTFFSDYIYKNVPMISERFMQTVVGFDTTFLTKLIILFDQTNHLSEQYHIPFFTRLDNRLFVHPHEIAHSIEKRIPVPINPAYLNLEPIFYIFTDSLCYLIIRLDLLESVLRNGVTGLQVTPTVQTKEVEVS